MFNLNSCIEVFGVQMKPQPSVQFAAVNKAVEPLCQFTFFDLRYNDISCLVPFWCRLWGWLSHASWDRQLGVNVVQVLCGIRLGTFPLRWSIRNTDWLRTNFLFHGLLLASCNGQACSRGRGRGGSSPPTYFQTWIKFSYKSGIYLLKWTAVNGS